MIFVTLVNHFYKKFNDEVKDLVPKIIESVLSVYERVKTELLPTPSKSHYTFNLRDIWRVFQGVCSGNPKTVTTPQAFIKLWYHENMRVFHDRLTTNEDREYLKELLASFFKDYGYEKDEILDV